MSKKYEIKISWYNHVSGYDSETEDTLYTDLNTAKRAMLKLLFEDDNIYEEDAEIEIADDLMSATVSGRHDDYTDYLIREAEEIPIDDTISDEITSDEIKAMMAEAKEENETLVIKIGK